LRQKHESKGQFFGPFCDKNKNIEHVPFVLTKAKGFNFLLKEKKE